MNQKQLNVAMNPVENSANQYIALTCSCIEKTGVRLYAFSSIFRSFPLFLKTDLVILNWFETLKARRFRFQKIIRFFIKRMILILLKITGKKLFLCFTTKSGMRNRTVFSPGILCVIYAKRLIKSLFYLMHQNPLCAPI